MVRTGSIQGLQPFILDLDGAAPQHTKQKEQIMKITMASSALVG
jgi:hypothetical protein